MSKSKKSAQSSPLANGAAAFLALVTFIMFFLPFSVFKLLSKTTTSGFDLHPIEGLLVGDKYATFNTFFVLTLIAAAIVFVVCVLRLLANQTKVLAPFGTKLFGIIAAAAGIFLIVCVVVMFFSLGKYFENGGDTLTRGIGLIIALITGILSGLSAAAQLVLKS